MQILFEDLPLDEAKVLVDALEHHRQLRTKLEIEAEEEMAKRREALERVIYGENEGRVFRNTNPENGLEGRWVTKASSATSPTLESEEFLREQFKMAHEAQRREIERTGDLNTPLRLTTGTLMRGGLVQPAANYFGFDGGKYIEDVD